ncbi:flagellar motor protein MotB [Litorisediminicola beolgyonensis]|uniref:Flagellar motor protein MotB n=1 Tax=Litorisediminicola beolgyonensis TaxID=1173614 RepID=A0ABW3ZH91_9RHOB
MSNQPIIIRKSDDEEHHDHHGGGWKVAYADFMTAMMAFFLMLWILNSADDEKLKGLAEYFTPVLSHSSGGGPGLLDGQTLAADGQLVGGSTDPSKPPELPTFGQADPLAVFDSRLRYDESPEIVVEYADEGESAPAETSANADAEGELTDAELERQMAQARREETLDAVEADIEQAIRDSGLADEIIGHLRFERTSEGLEVQIIDNAGSSMFASGSSQIDARTRTVIEAIARSIAPFDQPVMISGHTDAVPFSERSLADNWDLSSDRANATRRVLIAAGLDAGRVARVSGLADMEPLIPENPQAPENRRISVLLAYPEI